MTRLQERARELEDQLDQQRRNLREIAETGAALIEQRSQEILEAWQNPEERYLNSRLLETEARAREQIDTEVTRVEAELASITERLLQEIASLVDRQQHLELRLAAQEETARRLAGSLKELVERHDELAELIAGESAARTELALDIKRSLSHFEQATSERYGELGGLIEELASRLQEERDARESLASHVQRVDEARRAETNAHAETLGLVESRLGTVEGTVRSLNGTTSRLVEFVNWFKNAGAFARITGGR